MKITRLRFIMSAVCGLLSGWTAKAKGSPVQVNMDGMCPSSPLTPPANASVGVPWSWNIVPQRFETFFTSNGSLLAQSYTMERPNGKRVYVCAAPMEKIIVNGRKNYLHWKDCGNDEASQESAYRDCLESFKKYWKVT